MDAKGTAGPGLRFGRVLAVYLAAGAALGVGLVTGVLVGTIPLLNHLVRTGRVPWLVRRER